jgi:hypothetical protein
MFVVLVFKSYLKNQLMFSVKRSGRRSTPDALFLGGVKHLFFLSTSHYLPSTALQFVFFVWYSLAVWVN